MSKQMTRIKQIGMDFNYIIRVYLFNPRREEVIF